MKIKTLNLLIDSTQKTIDEKQLERFKIEDAISQLEHKKTDLISGFENEKIIATQNPLLPFNMALLLETHNKRLNNIEEDITKHQQMLSQKLDEIRELFIDLKKYERLLKNKVDAESKVKDKIERDEFDELAARITANK